MRRSIWNCIIAALAVMAGCSGCSRATLNYQIAESIGTVGLYENNEPVETPRMKAEREEREAAQQEEEQFQEQVSQAEALAFIFACTFNIPCVMALSTTYRESHSFKWTARVALFYIGSALILSCIVYHIAVLFLH